jgi:acyl-CoA synthetase (AMP-forming)/AMP-acid ligase II
MVVGTGGTTGRPKGVELTGANLETMTAITLMSYPFPARPVQDCAVIGLPDEKWGERLTAVLQLREGTTLDVAEITTFVKQRIGSVKTPKQIEVWPELPRSKVGKILKGDVKARLK